MGFQRAIRAFLLLMVIQLHCEILLAENGRKHSKTSDLLIGILPEKSKYLSDSEYNDDLEDYSDYGTRYVDDDHSDTYIIKIPKRHLVSEYTANSRQLSGRRTQYSNPDPHVTKAPARRSKPPFSEYAADSGLLLNRRMQYSDSDPHVTEVPARRFRSSDSESTANSRQLSGRRTQYSNPDPHVTKVPARRSKSAFSEYTANSGLLLNRRMQYSDSDPPVTIVPARRFLSSDSESTANSRQLLGRRTQYSNLDPHVTKVPARRSKSLDSENSDDSRELSGRRTQYSNSDPHVTKAPARRSNSLDSENSDDSDDLEQYSDPSALEELLHSVRRSQRRNLEISPKLKSEHSDIEHTVDLRQLSDDERRYLHPETADVTDQVSARKSQTARRSSRPSLRTFPDSNNVQQSNARRSLNPMLKLAKMGVDGMALLPQVFIGEPEIPKYFHYDEVRTIACPRGTQLVVDRCEPIFYSEDGSGARIKKIVRKSDIYLDDDYEYK